MMKMEKVIVCVLLMAGGVSFGQSGQAAVATAQSEAKQYKAVFVAKEVQGGKVMNSREYDANLTLNESPHGKGSIRTRGRIPVVNGYWDGKGSPSFQYMDVAVNIDFQEAHILGNSVLMDITTSISSVDAAPQDSATHLPPITRDNSWNGQVKVTVGKPEIIFSSDDVTSKKTMQLELTVTPVH